MGRVRDIVGRCQRFNRRAILQGNAKQVFTRLNRMRWTVGIGAILLAVLVRAEVLSCAAMRWSTPAMDRLAAEVGGDGEACDFPKSRWAGLYLIRGGQYLKYRAREDRDTYLYSAELEATFKYDSSYSIRSCVEWYSRYLTGNM